MRRWVSAACSMALLTACAGPHSTGALWAQQNVDQEAAVFRQGDAARAEQTRAYALSLVDEALASERTRLASELQDCPGSTQPLSVSPGDRVRDGIRVGAEDDPTHLAQVAQVALADWRLRRARATGNAQLCQEAQAALAATAQLPAPQAATLLQGLPTATVRREGGNLSVPRGTEPLSTGASSTEPSSTTVVVGTEPSSTAITLSEYALGYVDTVQGASPLPQYLAMVYGGFLILPPDAQTTDAETAAAMVDAQAAAYPQWEPDALYAALRGGRL